MFRLCSLIVLALCLAQEVAAQDLQGRVRFIDGDTLWVGRERVRLFGIDAPEKDQSCRTDQGADWRCGLWATRQARAMFDGQTARYERLDVDRYDRTVARCFVQNRDIGAALVRDGIAVVYRRYSLDCIDDEKQASLSDRGL